jgi:nicotinate-nucleotide--dimethylbenzimidazole phosphoribosyltransferase
MVGAACAGVAASSVLARQVGARLVAVDVGVAGEPLAPHPSLWHRRVRAGSDDLSSGPALSRADVVAALDVGAAAAAQLVAEGADLLVTGEMGIGNTTPAAAVIAALTGRTADRVTGRGTGIDDGMLAVKTDVVRRAVARVPARADAVAVLAEVGGLEIAALAGFAVGAAAARVPVVLDGVITLAGALAAVRLAPGCGVALVAGHRSVEPGADVALTALGLDPLLDLGLRLGEASGALLAVPLVRAAAAVLGEMATFDEAAVAGKD